MESDLVAVFDSAAVDTLDKLGIKLAGLPSNLYLRELSHLKDGATVVGDIFEPDLEALSALAPDLIILGGRSSTKVDATTQVAAMSGRYQDEMQGIARAFAGFVQRWRVPSRLVADPDGFRRDANVVLRALFERLQRESIELYPAAEAV